MSKLVRKIINTSKAPKAIGPYSQAVQINETLYISGQLGLDADTMEFVSNDVQEQANQALINMGHILKEAGASHTNVVKTTVLLADINDFAKVNDIYKNYFITNYPARAAYQCANLPKLGRVEIEAVAIVGDIVDAKL